MIIKDDKITIKLTAGEVLATGNVVYLSAASTVSKAATANAGDVIGVADADAAAGELVDVVVFGKRSVVADGTIAVGDRVIPAATAGRVIAENLTTSAGHTHIATVTDPGHTHTENLAAAYTVNAVTASATTGVTVDNSTDPDTIEKGRAIGVALAAAALNGSFEILVTLI